MVFDSRPQAGILLGEELKRRGIKADIVFGLARGGMAVAAEAAKILGVKLRPLVVRKIGAPGNPEFAVGAAAEIPGSQQVAVWWSQETIRRLRLSPRWQQEQVADKKREIREIRNKLLPVIRSDLAAARLPAWQARSDLSIILIDDGAATGLSMLAALNAAKTPLSGVAAIKTIVALPVASAEAAETLKKNADEVVILHTDLYLGAVGAHYRQFEQVSWDEVRKLLESVYETNQKTN